MTRDMSPLLPDGRDSQELRDEGLLDRMAEEIIADGLDEIGPHPEETPQAGGLTWIRSTLRSGGDSTDQMIGELFHGKYRILRKIGSGGFGVVYDALDERGAQNRVALKVMRTGPTQSESPLDMFRGEAVRVTRLHHPNIVDWKSFDRTPEGTYYFVMELLDGEQLSTTLEREGALDWKRAARILLQILDGLRAAHFLGEGQSILHLDLTPKNILLLPARRSRPEAVKVIDFGIGQYLGGEDLAPLEIDSSPGPAPPVPAARPAGLSTITSGSQDFSRRAEKFSFKISQACTPEYASPEQCAHIEFADGAERELSQLDGRSDIYSFGVIAYRMLTGHLPFKKPARRKLYLRRHQETQIEPWGASESHVPPKLRRFVERCLEKDPDSRWKDTQEAYEQLDAVLRPPAWRKLLAGAVGLVLLGVLLARFSQPSRQVFSLSDGPAGQRITQLHAGPAQPTIELYARSESSSKALDRQATWVLRGGDGQELEGWNITTSNTSGKLHLRATPGYAQAHPGRRVLDGVQFHCPGEPELSIETRFTLIWLGPESLNYKINHEALTIASTQSPSRESDPILLDPTGLDLELLLPNLSRQDLDIEHLRSSQGDRPLGLKLKPDSADASFRLSLSGLAPGPQLVSLELRDLAGGMTEIEIHIDARETLPDFHAFLERPDGRRSPWVSASPLSVFPEVDHQLLITSQGSLFTSVAGNSCSESTSINRDAPLSCSLDQLLTDALPGDLVPLRVHLTDRVLATTSRRLSHHEQELDLTLRVVPRSTISLSLRSLSAPEELPAYRPDAPMILEVLTPLPSDALDLELSLDAPVARSSPVVVRNCNERSLQLNEVMGALLTELPDGKHQIEVSAFMMDSSGQRITESPDVQTQLHFALDSIPPLPPNLAAHCPIPIVTGASKCPVQFLGVEDGGTSVSINWNLIRDGRVELAGWSVQPEPLDDQRISWTFDPLDGDPSRLPEDGLYHLEINAIDRAGNSRTLDPIPFEMSRWGPEISFMTLAPFSGRTQNDWETRGPRLELVPINIRVEDPNGVGQVKCRVVQSEHSLALHEAPDWSLVEVVGGLRPEPAQGPDQWSWKFSPGAEMSRASNFYVTIEASDLNGRSSHANSGPFKLPQLLGSYPASLDGMWLIEQEPGVQYIAGGTNVQDENQRLADLGLRGSWVGTGQSKPGESREPWGLPIDAGTLPAYYLDHDEVTVGEYLEFLRDVTGGYAYAENWVSGQLPRRKRRLELTEHYSSLDPLQAATGLRFDEANAYASWKNKRLPTLLELEYATRAGQHYRSFSWDGGPAPEDRDISDPWKRIAGLSRGAEWTCTPEWSPEHQDGRSVPTSARALSSPSEAQLVSARYFWVCGSLGSTVATTRDSRLDDFRSGTDRQRDWSSPRVGFRCALDAKQATSWQSDQ